MTSRADVRKLYTLYYWLWKLADLASVAFWLVLTTDLNLSEMDPENSVHMFKQKFNNMALSAAIFVDVCTTLSTLTLIVGE